MSLKILIIGSGPAGLAAAEAAKKEAPDAEVTILTKEAYLPYYRLRLFDVLSDPLSQDKLLLHPESWYAEKGIQVELNQEVKQVHPEDKMLELVDGRKIAYDRLIVATGSRSFVPPIKGADAKGVETLWTMEEAIRIEASLAGKTKGVIIGGGLLGLEAAFALMKKGIKSTILEVLPRLMTRQLDERAAELFTDHVKRQNVDVLLDVKVDEIVADETGAVKAVKLQDGRVLDADVVFISAGVRAVLDPIQNTAIKVDRAIVVDDHLETSVPGIYAAGDNAFFDGRWYGLWQLSQAQGKIAGSNAAGADLSYFMPVPPYTVNTMGIKISSAGQIFDDGTIQNYREEVSEDAANSQYQKLVYRGDDLIGFVLLGDTKTAQALLKSLTV